MREALGFDDFSILPMCVLKDEMVGGERISRVKVNDVFKPNPKMLPRAMGNEYVFTKYHFHDGVEILRILSGEATAVINNRTYRVRPDDVLIINPYEAHGLYFDSSETQFSRSCVIFDPKDIFPSGKGDTLFDRLRALRFKNYIRGGEDGRLSLCLDRIVNVAERGDTSWAVEEISLLVSFYSLAISAGVATECETDAPYRREFVTRVVDYVDQNLLEPLTTSTVADHCKYSTEHFCRLFKECFGATFKDYLTSCRIKLAKDKIDSGECLGVYEVAYSVGFKSVNHFTAMFSRHLGITPSEYIKRKVKRK